MENRIKLIKQATVISIIGNAILAFSKVLTGFLAGSLSVIGDGIDSSTDVVISCVSMVAVGIMTKASDPEHPYGHSRAETLATTVLAFVIFFAGAQLLFSTAGTLLSGSTRQIPKTFAIIITLASIAGKLVLALVQFTIGKKADSALLIANGKNMRNDVVISLSVLLGLFFTFTLKLPVLDSIMALLVSLWIIRSSINIFLETNTELMDGNYDQSLYLLVFEAVKTVEGALHPHRTRIRRLAHLYSIDLDIEVDGSLSVQRAHTIAMQVEKAIKSRIANVYDVMVHIEPAGNKEKDEQYGLSESVLKKVSPALKENRG